MKDHARCSPLNAVRTDDNGSVAMDRRGFLKNSPIAGIVFMDSPGADDLIHDQRRIEFYRQHLAELARAMKDGACVRANHAWSLLDNFEWGAVTRSDMG
jgi:beta-glucosidase